MSPGDSRTAPRTEPFSRQPGEPQAVARCGRSPIVCGLDTTGSRRRPHSRRLKRAAVPSQQHALARQHRVKVDPLVLPGFVVQKRLPQSGAGLGQQGRPRRPVPTLDPQVPHAAAQHLQSSRPGPHHRLQPHRRHQPAQSHQHPTSDHHPRPVRCAAGRDLSPAPGTTAGRDRDRDALGRTRSPTTPPPHPRPRPRPQPGDRPGCRNDRGDQQEGLPHQAALHPQTPPKDEQHRTPAITPELASILMHRIATLGLQPDDLLFPSTTRDSQQPTNRNTFCTRTWRPALQAAGLPLTIRMHDLRHAHASWLLAGGADLKTALRTRTAVDHGWRNRSEHIPLPTAASAAPNATLHAGFSRVNPEVLSVDGAPCRRTGSLTRR